MSKGFWFISSVILVLISGCFRLDDNLYNTKNDITAYELDGYSGEQDFVLSSDYHIPDHLIHVFSLNSTIAGSGETETIYAIYIGDQSKIQTDTVIMYCHGNKWHMDFYWQRAKLLAHSGGKNNYGVLMVDYRGYGLSTGSPSEEGMYADVDAGLSWLKDKGLTNDRLVVYGFSLGSAPSCELTSKPRSMSPFKLILESPYASAAVMVQDAAVIGLPTSFVTNLTIDNAEEIKNIQQPFMWLHGIEDDFLNIQTHGELVYNNHQGLFKEAHRVEFAGHSDVPMYIGFSNYCRKIDQFIRQ